MACLTALNAAAEEMNLRPLRFQIGQVYYLVAHIETVMRHGGKEYEYRFRVILSSARNDFFVHQVTPPGCHPHFSGYNNFCFGDNTKILHNLLRDANSKDEAKSFWSCLKYLMSLYTENAYGNIGYCQVGVCACITGDDNSKHCPECLPSCEVSGMRDIPSNFRFVTNPHTQHTYIVHRSIADQTIRFCLLCHEIIPIDASGYVLSLCPECTKQTCPVCQLDNKRVRVCNIKACPRRRNS